MQHTHPNNVIVEEIKARNWTIEDFYRESGLTNNIFARSIDKDAAIGLAKAFGTSAEFWLNLQTGYDTWLERDRLMSAHTIQAAMMRQELTEEEAFFILRYAGRLGYTKAIKRLSNPFRTIRKWFVWVGGWEYSELSQWDRGKPAWEFFEYCGDRKLFKSPTPISFLGHSITIQNRWISIKCFGGWLNIVFPNHPTTEHWAYWSPDGTPCNKRTKVLIPKKWRSLKSN